MKIPFLCEAQQLLVGITIPGWGGDSIGELNAGRVFRCLQLQQWWWWSLF